ncbi:hypothetical protein [Enterococcus casseliflavus]|uniref:hypothetical protein n=1 Tax=Enterococcus casseliflavus TaxID=37734 RepID=UPI0013309B72|nr:hypothetical protein [Enterococcus casseliflavus]
MDEMLRDIKAWLNHTKEGPRRTKEDLARFELLWNTLRSLILEIKDKENPEDLEKDFLDKVMYTGKIYRFHRKFKHSFPYGIDFDGYDRSWTAQTDLSKMYIFNKDCKYLEISRVLTEDDFGIDLNGFEEVANKYGEPFYLGSPAIKDEKEIIFPLKDDGKNEFKIIRL